MDYESLKKVFSDNFSLGYLNTDAGNKLVLISLICYLTQKLKEKKPGVTHYQLIMKLAKDLPENFVVGLSIICEDLAYGCTKFPNFGVEDKKIPETIKNLLKTYLPF